MIPTVIVASYFPSIVNFKAQSDEILLEAISGLLNLLQTVAIVVCVVVSISAPYIVDLLFGSTYREAASVLLIHIWAVPFVFMGFAGNKWYLVQGHRMLILHRTLVGAVVNFALNIVLIPSFGTSGAATATVVSQSLAAYFLDASSPKTIDIFIAKTRAIFWGPVLCIRKLR